MNPKDTPKRLQLRGRIAAGVATLSAAGITLGLVTGVANTADAAGQVATTSPSSTSPSSTSTSSTSTPTSTPSSTSSSDDSGISGSEQSSSSDGGSNGS